MDVDTRLLRYFAAVAAEGNLTRAAERLFTRSRAGMTLTSAGQALAERTPAVLASWECRCSPGPGPG